MKKLIVLLLLLVATPAFATLHVESWYQDRECTDGVKEYMNEDNTRTDCYIRTSSELVNIEYDFAHKWYECIGQAMHYATLNGGTARCVLIVEDMSEIKYIDRAQRTVNHFNLPVELEFVIP